MTQPDQTLPAKDSSSNVPMAVPEPAKTHVASPEIGGRGGLDPVRFGDWEKNGRCIDF